MPQEKVGPEKPGEVDTILLLVTLVLMAFGLVMVLSSSSYDALLHHNDAAYYFKRQLVFAGMGLFAMWIMSHLRPSFVEALSWPGFLLCIVMLLALPFVGIEVSGSKRWLGYGALRFAPAEVAKPIVIVFFASFLQQWGEKLFQSLKHFFIVLIVLAVIPGLVIIADLGTAVTIAGALFCMLVVANCPWRYIFTTIGMGVAAVIVMIILLPYRMKRIIAFWDPFADKLGDGYQVVQSLYAIGSGKLFGVGLGQGHQKLLHLPERHTDFIFSIICEELGLMGGLFVIILFAIFVWRGIYIASHIYNPRKKLVAFGLTCVIGLQAMINIGVAVGALPVTGITMPFISYGGTSLIFMLATVGYLLNMSRYVSE